MGSAYFWHQGSGFDMKYGIGDQCIFGDQGSEFEMKYGIGDQRILGIRDQDLT